MCLAPGTRTQVVGGAHDGLLPQHAQVSVECADCIPGVASDTLTGMRGVVLFLRPATRDKMRDGAKKPRSRGASLKSRGRKTQKQATTAGQGSSVMPEAPSSRAGR